MKKLFILFAVLFVTVLSNVDVHASYNYTEFGGIDSAEPMRVKKVLDVNSLKNEKGEKVEIGVISDMVQCDDYLYILDSELNTFHILNKDYVVIYTYDRIDVSTEVKPENSVQFNAPQGIAVVKEGNNHRIFIADTDNGRIVSFVRLASGNLTPFDRKFFKPEDKSIEDIESFKPTKIAVDPDFRVYCIATGVFEGIIDYNPDGSFNRFFGNNPVAGKGIWSIFLSSVQKDKLGIELQAVFNNLVIDDKNFIFTVSPSTENAVVQRMNYKGSNVLRQNGKVAVKGDTAWQSKYEEIPQGASELIDIDYNKNGYYSVLDSQRSRVFTYDLEGNLLYIFGEKGTQQNAVQNASALSYFGEEILVSDKTNANIVVYETTDYGKLINKAVGLEKDGLYDDSKVVWEEVLTLNTNCLQAYAGIGMSYYKQGKYQEAMDNFEKAYDRTNYSKAFKELRSQKMEKFYPVIMVLVIAGVVYVFASSFRQQIREVEEGADS